MKNTLCNAYVIYLNEKSSFSGFEIVTFIEIESYDGGTEFLELKTYDDFRNNSGSSIGDPFYRVFGLYKDKKKGKRIFGDFNKIEEASNFLEELVGLSVYIYSI